MGKIRSRHIPSRYLHVEKDYFLDLFRLRKSRLTPNLIVLGAQKCGTSSLHQYLNEHPDIFMSQPLKEPGYFVPWEIIRDYYKRKNTVFYSKYDLLSRGMLSGYRNQQYRGESSTFYTNGSYNITSELLIENELDIASMRFIYIMKDPIERIKSHYLHACRYNDFKGDLNYFVESNPEALKISCYGMQLEGYCAYLSENQILALDFDDLIGQPQSTMESVYKFLNLKPIQHKSFGIHNASPATQQKMKQDLVFDSTLLEGLIKELTLDQDRLKKLLPDFSPSWLF